MINGYNICIVDSNNCTVSSRWFEDKSEAIAWGDEQLKKGKFKPLACSVIIPTMEK